MIQVDKIESQGIGIKPTVKIQDNIPTDLPDILKDMNNKLNIMMGQEGKIRTANLPKAAMAVNAKLDQLVRKDKLGKIKRFKLKGKARTQMKTWYKKKKLLCFLLGTNRAVTSHVVEIRDGYILIDGVPRKCTLDYIYLYEGKMPCIFLPEWSLEPVGVSEYYKSHPGGLDAAAAQRMVIGAIESNQGELLPKKQMSAKAVVWLIIGGLVLWWVLSGGI